MKELESTKDGGIVKRPAWVIAVTVVQFLLGAFLLGTFVFLFDLILRPEVEPGADVAAVIRGFRVAAIVVGLMALLALVGGFALLTGKLWGWLLAVVTNLVLITFFIYSMVDEGLGNFDWEMAGATAVSVIVPVLLLLPAVRTFYWRTATAQPPQLSS